MTRSQRQTRRLLPRTWRTSESELQVSTKNLVTNGWKSWSLNIIILLYNIKRLEAPVCYNLVLFELNWVLKVQVMRQVCRPEVQLEPVNCHTAGKTSQTQGSQSRDPDAWRDRTQQRMTPREGEFDNLTSLTLIILTFCWLFCCLGLDIQTRWRCHFGFENLDVLSNVS